MPLAFHTLATSGFYTLSLHDALPISVFRRRAAGLGRVGSRPAAVGQTTPRPSVGSPPGLRRRRRPAEAARSALDRKSTRLNSSHLVISYAVFCLKKTRDAMELLAESK